MKVKRYLAKDIQEGMIKVKNELGRDAIILHTRKIKKPGISDFLQKPLIEVVAAVDSNDNMKNSKIINENKIATTNLNGPKDLEYKKDINGLDIQINNIKEMLQTVLTKVDESNYDSTNALKKKYIDMLVENGVKKNISKQILNIVSRQVNMTSENEQSIKNAIKIIIRDYLGTPYTIRPSNISNKPKIIFLVGPTGVGKTTTIAKLAAKLSIVDNNSVGLITSDTYRIGAVEQLKTYSEILGIPLSVVYEPNEIKEIIEQYNNMDYLLIDTAGRNHRNVELINELEKLIRQVDSSDIFLLVSLSTSYENILNIIDSYKFIDDYKLIFTKIDETNSIGNILNVRVETKKQLSYFTTGQSVPDDIETAEIDKIVNCIVGE